MAATWSDCKPNLCDLTLKSVEKLGFTLMTPVQVCEESHIVPDYEMVWCFAID